MADSTAKKAAPAGTEEGRAKRMVTTPADQAHLVAAILATAIAPQASTGEKGANPSVALVQRYRQIVRMLTRNEGEEGDD